MITATSHAIRRRIFQPPRAAAAIGSNILAASLRPKIAAATTEVCQPKCTLIIKDIAPAVSANAANKMPSGRIPPPEAG
jgi:hypothetical protein